MSDIDVLVVDDDPDHLEMAVTALRECCDPSRIATAPDGVEVLDFLLGRGSHAGRDTGKQPRLVLLDIKLRQIHGLQVLKTMRSDALTRWIPVVMLSGSAEKEELDSCYRAGANSVIRKTTDSGELRRKLRTVYEFWITVNEGNRHSRV